MSTYDLRASRTQYSKDMQKSKPGRGDGVRISIQCIGDRITTDAPGVEKKTLYHAFKRGLSLDPEAPCLGTRHGDDYSWMSYQEVDQLALQLGAGLCSLGVEPGAESSKICLYSKNRYEFDVAQLACYNYSLTPVPIYDTLGQEAGNYIVGKVECSVMLVDSLQKIDNLIAIITGTGVRHLVCFDRLPADKSQEIRDKIEALSVNLYSFDDILSRGDVYPQPVKPPGEQDLAIILNTSGTTGTPKGVMLTHEAYALELAAAYELFCYNGVLSPVGKGDIWFSYLPSAHAFNSVCVFLMLSRGAAVGYLSGNILKLMEDLAILKPTLFPIVPRLLNKLYDKIWANANASFIKSLLFNFATKQKLQKLEKGILSKDTIWDTIVFSKVQALLGGRVRMMIIGSAPISPEVLQFARVAFGCEILEAYGQTETCGGACGTLPGQYSTNTVGGPISNMECKLESVPEMNYLAENGQGEICFRGPSCFKGYFKDPEKTAETIDSEGWVHTGDIGSWNQDGTLRIFDRKKHIFKLSQGEYIAPEKIEAVYVKCPLVAQVFVHGDSLESWLVCVVVPDEEAIMKYAKQNNIGGSFDDLCKNGKIQEAVFAEMKAKAKEEKLNSLETTKAVHLHPDLFSIDNGLLTPTFKNKRNELKAFFEKELKEMYRKTRAAAPPAQ